MEHISISDIDMDTLIEQLLPQHRMVRVIFDTGEKLEMSTRNIVFHAHYWKIVRKWGFKITPKHVVDTTVISSKTLSKIGTIILHDVILSYPRKVRDLGWDIWHAINHINIMAHNNCQAYVRTISALDFIGIKKHPEVAKILDDRVVDIVEGATRSSARINENIVKLFDILKSDKTNPFYPFINLKLVNATQIAHIIYQVGFRTDVSEEYIEQPVASSYWSGLAHRNEYAYEALAAKKSIYFNKIELPNSDYFGRKQHLGLSSLKTIYAKDCGSKVTNKIIVTEANKKHCLYRYIIDGNRLVLLVPEVIDRYIGKEVSMRSPLTCKHTDGVCLICGGMLVSMMHPQLNVGIFAGTMLTNPVVQTILQTKHVSKVNIMEYAMPPEVADIFYRVQNKLFVQPKSAKAVDKMMLSIPNTFAINVANLNSKNLDVIDNMPESAFGKVTKITLSQEGQEGYNKIDMVGTGPTVMFSRDFVKHVALHSKDNYMAGDMFHIPLKGYDFKKPMFVLMIKDYSMIAFVSKAKKFIEEDIAKYTNITEALNDFCDLVYQQIDINIVYIELVLRATMIRSEWDMRLPTVMDPCNVTISTNEMINSDRALGPMLAYQGLDKILLNPKTYVMPRKINPFDDLLNLKPVLSPIE